MAATIQGQQTYNQFPAFAQPGQLADLAYAEIVSFPAAEVIQPGRGVMMAADGLSVQQMQESGASSQVTTTLVGISLLITAKESSGPFNITPFGVGGPQYNIGDSVPVLQRGRVYAEWKGTTQTSFSNAYNMYTSSTIATDRGKITDAATSAGAGTEVSVLGPGFRGRQALPGTGNIVLIDVNLPGAVS
jgi:hypothetical protein